MNLSGAGKGNLEVACKLPQQMLALEKRCEGVLKNRSQQVRYAGTVGPAVIKARWAGIMSPA